MRGILRPCRHRLGPELHARCLAHLCGLCLALRDTAGQPARVLTGYDVALVPILTEAQTGRLATSTAGACPLRGFRAAEVVDRRTSAMQAGTAVALLVGGAALTDKVADGDWPAWTRPIASRSAHRINRAGTSAADACGLDATKLSAAPDRARVLEARAGASLEELLEPAGTAVAAMFAHTAVAAGVPANMAALGRMGDAFGRLVNLVDATEDREADRRHGRFNPLEATLTGHCQAGELARSLHAAILASLAQMDLVDGALAQALLGPTLAACIRRAWGAGHPANPPATRSGGGLAISLAAAMVTQAAMVARSAMWGRGRRSGCGRPGPYGPYGEDPYYYGRPGYGPGWGYGRRGGCGGPSCGEVLACDLCANCACNECCGQDVCCCCV